MQLKFFNYIISNEKSDRWYITHKDWGYILYIRNHLFHWTTYIQKWLYKRKIYWHNWFTNECTPGFECCSKNISPEEQNILKNIVRGSLEGTPIYYRKELQND